MILKAEQPVETCQMLVTPGGMWAWYRNRTFVRYDPDGAAVVKMDDGVFAGHEARFDPDCVRPRGAR